LIDRGVKFVSRQLANQGSVWTREQEEELEKLYKAYAGEEGKGSSQLPNISFYYEFRVISERAPL